MKDYYLEEDRFRNEVERDGVEDEGDFVSIEQITQASIDWDDRLGFNLCNAQPQRRKARWCLV